MHRPSRFCGNKNSSNRKVQYIYRHDGHFLVVNNVPCEECEYCGERYFKADVLKTIEKEFVKIFSAKKKPKKQLKVPVEEFAELK